jgi:rhodanese-related sulfurtransferase
VAHIAELSPVAFVERWPPEDLHQVTLLDVREHEERAIASLAQAVHIPMREIPARLAELPRDKPIVVMCHLGGRSRRVAQYLAANGFEPVFNLMGGIDAWSQDIDSTVPRY